MQVPQVDVPAAPRTPASPPVSRAPAPADGPSGGGSAGGSTGSAGSAPSGGRSAGGGSATSTSPRAGVGTKSAGSATNKRSAGKDSGRLLASPGDEDSGSSAADPEPASASDQQVAAATSDTGAEGSPYLPFTGHNLATVLWLGGLALLAGLALRSASAQRLLRRRDA